MKLKISLITNCLLVLTLVVSLVGLYTKMNKLENTIMSLNYNQNLMLQQLEESENNITNINKEVKDIDKLINKYSKQFGVDKNLVKSIVQIESGGKQEVISSAGCVGLGQLAPNTAKSLGVNPYDTEDNIKGTVKYLAHLQKKFNGDTTKVIASYNAGPTAVTKHNGIPPYKETQNYVKKVKKEKSRLDAESK